MNHNAFLHALCDQYGQYTGHCKYRRTMWYTDIPAVVTAGVRKMAHDEATIIRELLTAISWAGNLHKLQIYTDSPMEFGSDSRLAGNISLHTSDMASHMLFHGVPVMIVHQWKLNVSAPAMDAWSVKHTVANSFMLQNCTVRLLKLQAFLSLIVMQTRKIWFGISM